MGTVIATDADGDDLDFAITAGNTESAFEINGDSGELTVSNSAALDFEINPKFILTVTVGDGQLTSSAEITIDLNDLDEEIINEPEVTGLEESEISTVISLFPNPAGNEVTVSSEKFVGQNIYVRLYSVTGMALMSKLIRTQKEHFTLDLININNGVYLLSIQIDDQIVIKRIRKK